MMGEKFYDRAFRSCFIYNSYKFACQEQAVKRKRQIMRQSLNSTPPVMGGAASGIRQEDYLTMA